MLKALRSFLNEIAGDEPKAAFSPDDHRLAAAALLYHVVAVDGIVSETERTRLHELLKAYYALGEAETDALVDAAVTADEEAVDLYHFTSLIKEKVGEADREEIIAMMWDLAYRDGSADEFEDNVIWRVAELLGVSSRTRIRLKKLAQSATSTG